MTKELFYEISKGLTDVPIVIMSAAFGLILFKKYHKSRSALMFLLLLIASALGTVVHTSGITGIALDVFWMILYVFLFETVRCFAQLFCGYIRGKNHKEYVTVRIIESILLLAAIVCRPIIHIAEIVFLLSFCIIQAMRLVICLIKTGNKPRGVIMICVSAVCALLFQMMAQILPYGVILGHVAVWCAMTMLFIVMKNEFEV